MKTLLVFLVLVLFFLLPGVIAEIPFVQHVSIEVPTISIVPEFPQQGEPLLIVVDNSSTIPLQRIMMGTNPLNNIIYHGKPAALFGIDLTAATGTRRISAVFADGQQIVREFSVAGRKRITAPLGIPQKLGGNTKASQTRLVTNLVDENGVLNALESGAEMFWTDDFRFPLASTTVTDTYGYSRLTGDYAIPHKGVDFKAAKGTPVFAMNRGVVKLAEQFRVYGNTIVIDHGLGVQTFYMHLSDMRVEPGKVVERGDVIGFSGDSGYAESPHLHISVRIGGVSIDPLVFLSFFSNANTDKNR